jgi:hypothetical protein
MTLQFKPGYYLAFELAPSSRGDLLSKFPPKYARTICHHITVKLNLTEDKLNTIIAELGTKPLFKVFGYSDDGSLECFSVAVDTSTSKDLIYRPDGKFYHITHSLEHHRRPVDSNTLLVANKGIPFERFKPIMLRGELQLLRR